MSDREPTELLTRQLDPDAPVLGRMATLETRLARTTDEVRDAQSLRYEVFYEEMGAQPSPETQLTKRDKDEFDRHCDHLLVIDHAGSEPRIVGTYRILLGTHAPAAGGFYSQSEFDLDPMLSSNNDLRFMELGRSCILPEHRSKRVMELLWHGNWAYAVANEVDVMFGCASFAGTDPNDFANSLGWLGDNAILENDEDCTALRDGGICLADYSASTIDARRALAALPPLLKGYLRLGAKVASQAVIDRQFGTTDVLVVLKVADIAPRYIAHYGANASRYAA